MAVKTVSKVGYIYAWIKAQNWGESDDGRTAAIGEHCR